MTRHILEEKELQEFKYILELLKSKDKESIRLGTGLLKNYPYTMTDEQKISFNHLGEYWTIGSLVCRDCLLLTINVLERIIEYKKYYYDDKHDKWFK